VNSEPLLTPAQRRVLTWALVALTLALAAAAGIALLRRATSGYGFGKRAEPIISQAVVVERLRDVAKLVASEMTLRDVVTYEQTQFHSTKRTLLVVTARDSAEKHIVVSLPPSQIMSVDVLNVTTYDERAGLWNPFRPEDRDAIQARIRGQLVTAAQQSGILAHADQSAVKVLTELLSRDGYTVEIRRPPVRQPPAG
jgi:hypothetical protein